MKTIASKNRHLRVFAAALLCAVSIISSTLTLSGVARADSSTDGSHEECRNAEENSLC